MAPLIQNVKIPQYNYQQQSPNFSAADNNGTSSKQNNSTTAEKIIQNNALINAATTAPEKPSSFAASAIASLIAMFGLNKLINLPLLSQEYDKTLFKKIENFGDKIAQNGIAQKAGNYLSVAKNKATSVVDNSEILRTLFRKPSLGGSQAMTQAMSTRQHLASKALETITLYNKKHPNVVFEKLIKRIGEDKDTYKYYDEIFKAISKSGANVTEILTEKTPFTFGLLKNKTSLREILNKKVLVDNYNNGKTLGQKLSGYFMRGTESITNGFFGGKGALLLQSLFIAQSLNEASKAEKGEKFQTFMGSLFELMAYVATAGLQLRVVNSLAGLKYMGFSPMGVKRYKAAIKLANKAAQKKDFASHAYYSLKATNLRKIAADGLSWYQKPLKWVGNLMSLGRIRETIKPLKSGVVSQMLSKAWYGLKFGAGWIGRVGFIMAVLMPLFAGAAKKIAYAIFGTPKKTIEREKQKELEEKQKMEEEAKAAENEQSNNTQKSPNTVEQPSRVQPVQPTQSGSLIDKMKNIHNTQQPVVQQNQVASQPMYPQYQQPYYQQPVYQQYPQQPMYQQPVYPQYQQPLQPIAAAPVSQKQQAPDSTIKRSYVPNPVLGPEKTAVISDKRMAQIDNVMRQADWAETQAAKYL